MDFKIGQVSSWDIVRALAHSFYLTLSLLGFFPWTGVPQIIGKMAARNQDSHLMFRNPLKMFPWKALAEKSLGQPLFPGLCHVPVPETATVVRGSGLVEIQSHPNHLNSTPLSEEVSYWQLKCWQKGGVAHHVSAVGGNANDLSINCVTCMINTKGEKGIIMGVLVQFSQRR